MRTSSFIALVFLLLFYLTPALAQQNNPDVQGSWNGTVSYSETFTGMIGTGERHVEVTIVQNKVSGSHRYTAEGDIAGIHSTTSCQSIGDGELHIVTIRNWDSTYDIQIVSPSCTGSTTSTAGSQPFGPEQKDIIISDKKYNTPDFLSGTETTIRELPGDMGKITMTIKWSLSNKPIFAELIVTPEDYDNWLPIPGKDELTKGSVMAISLKLRGKDGKPLKVKAKSFELHLSNTSKEPGITINYPVSPRDNQLPDLRFLPTSVAESVDEGQFISIPCNDGSTGKVYIGSYDGGGWTTLTAEAILQDDTHIKGQLLVSGGEENILIPKRTPGTGTTPESRIATAWLQANGNPGEMDDGDTSKGNKNNGDGLTAYEEYRGVISEGKFKRLDPYKKEIGILATQTDFFLFDEGIGWFKNASDLSPVRFDFDKNEVAPDRKINMNAKSAHNYDQYAIHLLNGSIAIDFSGMTYTTTNEPSTPSQVISVVIDVPKFYTYHDGWNDAIGPLPNTKRERLANLVAHELSHAVNVWHHGQLPEEAPSLTAQESDRYRIFDRVGKEIFTRPYTADYAIGKQGGLESGDLSCVMPYNPCYNWAIRRTSNGTIFLYQVPLVPTGRTLCSSNIGTDINAPLTKGVINYFSNATKGNCLSQIKLKN